MNFPAYFAKKIAFSRNSQSNLSGVIIRIGQIAVILGILVSIISVSTGIGAKKAIKEKLTDFNGHLSVKGYDDNNSVNSTLLNKEQIQLAKIKANPQVNEIEYFAQKSGVIRTEKDFAGVVFKGITENYNWERFQKFMIQGRVPVIQKNDFSNEVLLSEKIANELHLKIGNSFVIYFINDTQKPIYRKFILVGIYRTDIKPLDDVYMIGDIKHIRHINHWEENQVGGMEIFLNDVEKIDETYTQIESYFGLKNFAEKATTKFAQITDWVDLFDTNIVIILIIMTGVVSVNMIMVLLILIIERTASIGLLKTFGATNRQIRTLFINYTLLIMIPGIIIGNIIALALLLSQKYFNLISLPPENYYINTVPVYLNLFHLILISVAALFIAMLAMLLPSSLIAKISPIQAIKQD